MKNLIKVYNQLIPFINVLILCVLAAPFVSNADDEGYGLPDFTNSFDFQTLGGMNGRLAPHGNDLMGDMIDKNTGAITFNHTDVSIPGNSKLEVSLRRKLQQGVKSRTPYQQAFSDWALDIPIAYFSYGYEKDEHHPVFNGGCMTKAPVDTGFFLGPESLEVRTRTVQTGVTLSIPGASLSGFQSELQTGLKDPKADWISGGQGTDYNGNCAEIAIAPDGTKYKFGRHTFRTAKRFRTPYEYNTNYTYYIYLGVNKKYAVYLITEVVDVHGNSVRYEYNNDNELTSIVSNDGREINLEYNSPSSASYNSALISKVTAHGRDWLYTYDDTDILGNSALDKTVLPDGRFWKFDMINMGTREWEHWNCKPLTLNPVVITHPDGAKGTFTLNETRHIKNAIYGEVYGDNDVIFINSKISNEFETLFSLCAYGQYLPADAPPSGLPFFRVLSLTEKELSGKGIPEATTWRFEYRGYGDDEADLKFDDWNKVETWTKITEPDNTTRTYTYDAIGKSMGLLKEINVVGDGGILEIFTYEYDVSNPNTYSDCAFINSLSHDEMGSCFGYNKRPQTKVTHVRDGVTYTTEKDYDKLGFVFTDYDRPNKITKSSSLQVEERITDIEYEHNVSSNIIGLVEKVVRNGKEFTHYSYNAKGQKEDVYSFGDKRLSYGYNTNGTVKTITEHVTGSSTNIAKLENYYRGQPRKITRRDGGVLLRTIDANGWVTSETDALGYHTTYGYNDAGWMTSIGRPSPWNDTTITYSNLGTSNFYSTEVQGASQNVVWYDAMLRPVLEKKNPTSGVGTSVYVKTEYDYLSRVVFSSLPSFSSNSILGIDTGYDGLGRVTNTTENFSPYVSSATEYLSGNRVRVTDPHGHQTTTTRSGYASPNDGNTTLIQSPEGVNTAMTFDIYGNMLTTTQSGGGVSSTQRWFYDDNLRLCRHHVPETGSKLFQYNNIDQVTDYSEGQSYSTACTTPSTNKVSLTYDPVGRLLTTNFPSPTPDITRDYDLNGNLETVTRGTNQWLYTYFDNNQLETEELTVDGLHFNTTYTRDGNGALSGIGYPSGDYVSFSPDGFGRATKALASNSDYSGVYANSVQYHPNDVLNTFEYGNGVQFSQTLNTRQLPDTRDATLASGQDPMKLTYTYDYLGNATHITDGLDSSRNITNSFDGLGRLKTSNSGRGNFTFHYDALGNLRLRNVVGGSALGGPQHAVNITFNSINQVNTATNLDGTRTFVHDNRGNVESNGTHNFVYDYANQPTSISGGQTGNFTYDGNLKRIKQIVDGKTTYSVYTQEAGLVSQYNKTTSTHTDHIRVAGTTVARVESQGSQADSSTTAFDVQTTSSGTAGSLSDRPHYLPFGKSINGTTAKENAIGFTGHIEDTSGLVYMQARYYDPVIGRFLSNDPVGYTAKNPVMSFNRYMYANNNPYKFTDPDGKFADCFFCKDPQYGLNGSPVRQSVDGVMGEAVQGGRDSVNSAVSNAISQGNDPKDSTESITDYTTTTKQDVANAASAVALVTAPIPEISIPAALLANALDDSNANQVGTASSVGGAVVKTVAPALGQTIENIGTIGGIINMLTEED